MTEDEKILALMDQYFDTTDPKQLADDLKYVNSLGSEGVTFDEYLDILNDVTSFELAENGICDDIAYSDYFNKSIMPVMMDKVGIPTTLNLIEVLTSYKTSSDCGYDNWYPMAA